MRITVLTGAPAPESAPAVLFEHTARVLAEAGHTVTPLATRELPTVALLAADTDDPVLAEAIEALHHADAVVVAGHIHRAAYSGLVQSVLELLPERALADKPVLPLAVGGTQGRVVALEYALCPLLAARGANRVLPGAFFDEHEIRRPDGGIRTRADTTLRTALDLLIGEQERFDQLSA